MRKIFFLLAAVWMAAAGTVKAADKELYAVKMTDGDEIVMYLCYDEKREILGGVTNWSAWRDEVTQVNMMISMADARPTSTGAWFRGFAKLKEIVNLSILNTYEVTEMQSMFEGCSSLTSLDLTTFYTAKVQSFQYMFKDCTALTELNLLGWNMSSRYSTREMFSNCAQLTTIYCESNWWTGGYMGPTEQYNYGDMFKGCTSLKGGRGTVCNGTDNINILYARPDGENGQPGYFSTPLPLYTVRFFDFYNMLIGTYQMVEEGQAAEAPEAPEVPHYHFTGWDKAFDHVTADLDVYAQYAIDTYTVKFYDVNNHLVSTQTVEYGHAAEAPELDEVEGYIFVGWDAEFDFVTEDMRIYPVYEKDSATGLENTEYSIQNTEKMLRNGTLYILIGEKMYDATGRLVK